MTGTTTTRKAATKRTVKAAPAPDAQISKRRSHSQFVGVHDAMLAKGLRPARVLSLGAKGWAVVDKASIVKDPKGNVQTSKLKILAGPVKSQSSARRALYAYENAGAVIVKPGQLTKLRADRAKMQAARKAKAVATAKSGKSGSKTRPTRARKAA